MSKYDYDVIIIGGGTAGVSCAWNCARLGLKPLIIEEKTCLGGSITNAMVIPAMKTSNNSINNLFFDELYKNLKNVNGAIEYSDGNRGWFNPELLKIVLEKMLIDIGVDIIYETHVAEVKTDNCQNILSISLGSIYNDNIMSFRGKDLSLPIKSKYYIDGTGDGNFCKKLNCNFLNNNKTQPVNLRFIMSGVNVQELKEFLFEIDSDRDVTSAATVGDYTYISTAYTWDSGKDWALAPLFKQAIASNDLTNEDANYFQIFSVAGTSDSIAFNCPRIIDKTSRTQAYIEAKQSILRIATFCKKYLKGFGNAYISNIANSLGVRVSNLVKGKYVYTYNDIVTGKKFKEPVVQSNYPIDIHNSQKDSSKLIKLNQDYQLPIESLISADYDNLYMIGRCISAEFEAQAALRIIPSCFSMGEGLAKYLKSLD